MTKECMCGMAASKMQSNLKSVKMDLRIAKEIAKEDEEVSLNQKRLSGLIDNIENESDKIVFNCGISEYFSYRTKEQTRSMQNTIKKRIHTHSDIMNIENNIIFVEDYLDTHLKGCAIK
jgi:hypothetical protein